MMWTEDYVGMRVCGVGENDLSIGHVNEYPAMQFFTGISGNTQAKF